MASRASGKYAGTVTLRQGLAYSINTSPFVLPSTWRRKPSSTSRPAWAFLADDPAAIHRARHAGSELLDLIAAYAPFANGGMDVIPRVIAKMTSKDGTQPMYPAMPAHEYCQGMVGGTFEAHRLKNGVPSFSDVERAVSNG